MKYKSLVVCVVVLLMFSSCGKESKFPLDKKYWDTADYDDVVWKLKYATNEDEKLPTFDDPENSKVIEKLVDQENFNVVLDDKELGIKHKSEAATKFFSAWKEMSSIYSERDRKDMYVYERERMEIFNFGLALQLKYFKLGNEEISENADDATSEQVKNNIDSNIGAMESNYIGYLDEINNEQSYSATGLNLIADGIDNYCKELVLQNPTHNFDALVEKIDLMFKKTKSGKIRQSLAGLKSLIEAKKVVVKAV
jgi:hypothetical protein